ncbi:MAG: hypothetical protein E7456_01875 [Ruminococcaceae bacterium]|nr:hypothetical protein [Oscillospiraceae bacterium]
MADKNNEKKKPQRYPSPILLIAAAIYLGYMAYSLWETTGDGSVAGTGLILSWIGCIAFAILTVVLIFLAVKFNRLNNQAIDEELAREREELDSIVFEDADATAEEETEND